MSDLLTELRRHDLPPRWDGCLVQWAGWEYVHPVFLCPPTRDVCEGCGMPTTEKGFPAWSTNWGTVAISPRITSDDLAEDARNRHRLGPLSHKRPPIAFKRLCAFRCHSCSLDRVWDTDTDEWWVLDHTDYDDGGSDRPTQPGSDPASGGGAV